MATIRVRFKDAASLAAFKSECGVNLNMGQFLGLGQFDVTRENGGYVLSRDYLPSHIERYFTKDEFENYIEVVEDEEDSRLKENSLGVTIVQTLTIKNQITKDNWREVVMLLEKTFGG